MPKRQVHTRSAGMRFFVDSMLPIALGLPLHQEQAAGRKPEADWPQRFSGLMLHEEGPFFPYTHRRNNRSFPKLRFIVVVEPHAVAVVPVVIEQNTIKVGTSDRFNSFLDI